MSKERRQVLEMLAQGKISAEDAERLLDKLGSAGTAPEEESAQGTSCCGPGRSGRLKFIRIQVDSKEGEAVNIRVPLAFVRAGIRLSTIMPSQAKKNLEAKGIDLSHLNGLEGEELLKALGELHIDVDSSDGDKVKICCE